MDSIIGSYPGVANGDLFLADPGVAYQLDRSQPYEYGHEYFANYMDRENTPIALKLNRFRTDLSSKYCDCVLDVGIGSGEFIKNSRIKTYGYDVNPLGVAWLKRRGIFVDPYGKIPDEVGGLTLWDTMEHIAEPTRLLRRVRPGAVVFVSLPVFDDVRSIRESKHYKPDEHLYYFTERGLCRYMGDVGFVLLESSFAETEAGREHVESFVFRRVDHE